MYNLKRLVAIILNILIITVLFTGCGNKNGSEADSNAENTVTPNTAFGEGTVDTQEAYVPEYVSLPDGMAQITNFCVYDNQLYFGAYVSEAQAETSAEDIGAEYSMKLYKMDFDGTGLTELSGYKAPDAPEGKQVEMYISTMNIDDEGNMWVAESYSSATENENIIYLRKLDLTGAELLKADISELAENKGFIYINGMQFDSKGSIYISDMSSGVYVYDREGKHLSTLDMPIQSAYIGSLIKLVDGSIAAFITGGTGFVLKPINQDSKGWEADIPINIAYGAYSGSGDYDFYYNDGSNLIGYSIEKNEGTKLLTWIDSYINSNSINSLVVLPDETIFCSSYSMDGEAITAELAILTKQMVTVDQNKTVLELACFGLDANIRAAIAEFNKQNEKYRINATDYLEFSTSDDMTAGLTKLNTEIISGKTPDLLCTMGILSLDRYISKGLLEDLYPYIDNDAELGGRNAFIQEVLSSLETDGALYQIAPEFTIYSVLGKREVIGDRYGWTYDEMIQLIDKYSESIQIIANATANDALSFVALSMDDYVNWQTGECYFDSESFIDFLEFANRFPNNHRSPNDIESSYSLIKDGRALLDTVVVSSFLNYQMYRILYGGDITLIGYPCDSGSGSAFFLLNGISMFSKCENKDAVWEFIRSLLTEDYQTGDNIWQFPINKVAFEIHAQEAMKKETIIDENGEEIEIAKASGLVDGQMIEIYAATQEDIDQISELVSNIDKTMEFDREVLKIIQEEAQPFFNGQKSAKDVAVIIQQRVSTYVNEQR